jgi:hypothetical protein
MNFTAWLASLVGNQTSESDRLCRKWFGNGYTKSHTSSMCKVFLATSWKDTLVRYIGHSHTIMIPAKAFLDHCIETLRQGIMCRGDVSLGTYTYLSGTSNVTARSWASHQCVDTDALLSWAKARSIDIFAHGVLVKPEDVGPEHITEKKEPH